MIDIPIVKSKDCNPSKKEIINPPPILIPNKINGIANKTRIIINVFTGGFPFVIVKPNKKRKAPSKKGIPPKTTQPKRPVTILYECIESLFMNERITDKIIRKPVVEIIKPRIDKKIPIIFFITIILP